MHRTSWNIAVYLMGFIVLNQLLVLITFITSTELLPFVFPLSFLLASFFSVYKLKLDGIIASKRYFSVLIGSGILLFSLLFSTFFDDFTFDGQWYHHPAIYKLENGWNPFQDPLGGNHTSILHFPKATWYFSASVYSTFGVFGLGKCLNVIMAVIAGLLVYATLLDYKLNSYKALTISILVILHPVVWSEVTTFQNDNNLYLNLVVYSTAIFSWLRTKGKDSVLLGTMAGISLINIKFTGLIFLSIFAAWGFLYFLIYRSKFIWKYMGIHAIILLLGVVFFGFNPYVTNFIHRNHPLYPILGTEEYPSHVSEDNDMNEDYETPKNMMGKSTLTRFFYANFSSPSNAPYNDQKDAELIFPFSSKLSDWSVYRFHDLRIAAFGPFFSGILLISFGHLFFMVFGLGKKRWHLLIPLLAVFTSLLISKHFWWARFAPQLWLFPIVIIVTSFLTDRSIFRQRLSWSLMGLTLLNGLIVLVIHLNWVRESTLKQRKQLTEIRDQGKPIEICMYWFSESMNKKLLWWGIEYREISMEEMNKLDQTEFIELNTVVNGYPGMNRYRVIKDREE